MGQAYSRDELLADLAQIGIDQEEWDDLAEGHMAADEALVRYIDDTEIREAYEALKKWH